MLAEPIDASTATVETETLKSTDPDDIKKKQKRKWFFLRDDIRWQTTIVLASIHLLAFYGLFTFPYLERYKTILWGERFSYITTVFSLL